MHGFWEWVAETFIARSVVNMEDHIEANHRMHYWNGIVLCVMIIAHVWSILTPVIFSGYGVKVWFGEITWYVDEIKARAKSKQVKSDRVPPPPPPPPAPPPM